MSCNNQSNINETFIIEPIYAESDIISACTTVYTNALVSCSGNTSLFMGTNVITFDGNIYTNDSLTANTIDASVIYSGGTNIANIFNGSSLISGNFNTSNNTLSLYNSNGSMISVTGFTDYFITGITYANNQIVIGRNDGVRLSSNINSFSGLTITGQLVAQSVSATTYYGNGSNLTGIRDYFTTGVTIINDVVYFNRNDVLSAYTLNLSAFSTNDIYVTGVTYSNNKLTLSRNDNVSLTANINSFTALTVNTLSATTVSATTYYGNGSNLTGIHDYFTTGATIINNIVYFNRNDALSAYTLNLSAFSVGDIYVTGVTYSNNKLTLSRNDGINLTANINSFTALTVNTLSATTLSATTYYGSGSNLTGIRDYFTTGATIINNIVYFNRNDVLSAYTLNLSAFSTNDIYVTGVTYSNNKLTLSRNDNVNLVANFNSFTALTVDNLSATTLSATTYYGNGSNLTGIHDYFTTATTIVDKTVYFNRNDALSAYTLNLSAFSTNDFYVTGVTYSNNKLTLSRNDGINLIADINSFTALTVNTLSATTYLNLPSTLFTANIPVSLSSGKTFGRYVTGDIIPASGKTAEEVMNLIAREPIPPTLTLTSPTTIQFNQTAISNVLNFTKVINSLNASVSTAVLEWRRNNTGTWATLTNSLTATTYTHSITDTAYNTQPFNYRYNVVDSLFGSGSTTLDITPIAYASPTISSFSVGSTIRDLGNINVTITGTITKNSTNVPLSSYQIQYQINNTGSWINIGSATTISGSTAPINVNHNDIALVNSTNLEYRVVVIDSYQTTTITPSSNSIAFTHRNFLGFNTGTTLTLSQILLLDNSILTNAKTRAIANITATGSNYTYYVYAASAGDLTNIILDGAAPILGAFTKLTDVSGTNTYGANVTYRIYKTNSTNAFTNNTLAFS